MARKSRDTDRQGAFSGNRANRAIIDIGSNTVRLVLYGGSPRAPVVLFNEKVAARLGREIAETGRLAYAAVESAMGGLRRYALVLAELKIDTVDVVATAAVREAANGSHFVTMVEALGFSVRILSGEDEARISASGVLGAFPGAHGVVADLGGGSLELAMVAEGGSGLGTSLPLGTLRLPDHRGADQRETSANLQKMLQSADWIQHVEGALYLVGGTWRAMAVAAMLGRAIMPGMQERGYDRDIAAGLIVSGASLAPIIPPSLLAIIVGSLADVSIAKLLIAGVMPGLLMGGIFILYVFARIATNPDLAPANSASERGETTIGQQVMALVRILPFAIVIFSVMGFIMLGIATPSESAATGVVGALITAAIYRNLSFKMCR